MRQRITLIIALVAFVAGISAVALVPSTEPSHDKFNAQRTESISLINDNVDDSTTAVEPSTEILDTPQLPVETVETTTPSTPVTSTPVPGVVEVPQVDPVVPPTTQLDPPSTVPPPQEAPVEDPPAAYTGPGTMVMCGSLPCCPKSITNANGDVVWLTPDGKAPSYQCSNDGAPVNDQI